MRLFQHDPKANTDGMWQHYNVKYRQKAEASHNTNWSTIDTAIFINALQAGQSRCNAAPTVTPSKMILQPTLAEKETSHDSLRGHSPNNFN